MEKAADFQPRTMKVRGSIKVKLGDGNRKFVQGCCKEVMVELEEFQIIIDFYVFYLGKVDLILGIDWLATLERLSLIGGNRS
ncbi:hypothetical protein CR513_08827, partial [Mucuna pruriens]